MVSIEQPAEQVQRKIDHAFQLGKIGKTDCCVLGMMQDKFTISNPNLLDETINQFVDLKQKVFSNFKEGKQLMQDMLYELYSTVKDKKCHILQALTLAKEDLDRCIKAKGQPFQRASRHREEYDVFQKGINSALTISVTSKQITQQGFVPGLPLKVFLVGQLLSGRFADKVATQAATYFVASIDKLNNASPSNSKNAITQMQMLKQYESNIIAEEKPKIRQLSAPRRDVQSLPLQVFRYPVKDDAGIVSAPLHPQGKNKENDKAGYPQSYLQYLPKPPQYLSQQNSNPSKPHMIQKTPQIQSQPLFQIPQNPRTPKSNPQIVPSVGSVPLPLQKDDSERIPYQPQNQEVTDIPFGASPFFQQFQIPPSEQKMMMPCTSSKESAVEKQYSPEKQSYFNKEVKEVLDKVEQISEFERDAIMKLFGKFEQECQNPGSNQQIKQKYPEIVSLSQASKALEKAKGVKVRVVQSVSCLLFLFKQKKKGRILQINTGEGKSITVALMAGTIALMGQQVDIFTSNKTLAKRDCEEFEEYYKELGLTCGSIGSEEMRSSEPNEEYKKSVVYGDVGSYAADLLGEYYEQKGTRCARKFNYAIVDEVDCMFIDQHNHSTSLAKPIPGLSKLNSILWLIWYKIQQMSDNYLQGYYYYNSSEGNTLTCRADDFVQSFIEDIIFGKEESQENQIQQPEQVVNIKKSISKSLGPYLKAFALTQVKEWVRNGFYSLELQRNKEYKVEDEKVVPIDFDNTGVAQANTQWRGGLHQFIQMKENVTVTPMSMTVNFVSNVFMFLLYRNNLIGLTGTLGTQQSISVLEQFYTVDTMKVPPFKPRKLELFQPIITDSTSSYASTLTSDISEKQKKGRPCLLICESEKSGKQLVKLLTASFPSAKLIQYYSGDESIEKDQISEFCIFISTNLAGRGTDIKLSEDIIEKGGLHVIVSFTPKNKRVEDQAFGRAGRGGQPGSAVILVDGNKDTFIKKQRLVNVTSQSLIEERDKIDAVICERQLQNMRDISKMDNIFWDFCKTLNSCQALKDKQYLRKQEEELWATFYCKIQYLKSDYEKAKAEYDQFKIEFQKRVEGEGEVLNPTYQLNEALRLITGEEFQKAVDMCESTSSKFPGCFSAHYLKAFAFAGLKKHSKAIAELEICEGILKQNRSLVQAMQIVQLQSQSLVQQEYSQDLLRQSVLLNRDFQMQLQQSHIFDTNNLTPITKEQLEQSISSSGCFKRIKDAQLIKGKLLEHVRETKEDLKVLHKHPTMGMKMQFVPVQQFFAQDKVQELVLKEFSNEELPCIICMRDSGRSMLKSLIPLASAIFQLANSLYLMQVHGRRDIIRLKYKLVSYQTPEQQLSEIERGVAIIAESVKKIVLIGDCDLRQWLPQSSILLLGQIQEYQIQDYQHLQPVNNKTASAVQQKLLEEVSIKNELVKQVVGSGPEISDVAKEMTNWTVFSELQKQSDSFRTNCQQFLANQNIQQVFMREFVQLERLKSEIKKYNQLLNSEIFLKELTSEIVASTAKECSKQIEEQLELFISQNYMATTPFNQFSDMVLSTTNGTLSKGVDHIVTNLKQYLVDALNSLLGASIKNLLRNSKKQLSSNALLYNNPNTPNPNGYIQQKQSEHEEKRIKCLQNCYTLIKQDKSLTWTYLECVMACNGSSRLLEKAKQLLFQKNQNYQKEEASIDTLSTVIGAYIVSQEQNTNNKTGLPRETVNLFLKEIADQLISPVFKSTQHVFLKQIESNAILALFKHMLP